MIAILSWRGLDLDVIPRPDGIRCEELPDRVTMDQVAQGAVYDQHQYCIAITFDDGYRDNFVCAFPILKKLGIPATIFLATEYMDSGQLPWYDQVRLAFKLTTRAHFYVDRGVAREAAFERSFRHCGFGI